MAYVPQTQDDEEKRRAEAGGGALGSFGSTQGAAAPTQPKFVNVADYLSKNTEGSANIANAASGKLEQQRDEASTAANEAGTRFNQDVQSGSTNLDENLLGSALSKPEDFVKDPNNTAKFLAMRDASYKGPQSLQSTDYFAPTQAKVTGLGTTASGLGTESGRNALVQSLSDHPTQGKTSLNQLLLQGNPDSSKKIQDTAGTFKSVEDQWAQLLANAPGTADAARAATDVTRNTTQSRLGDTTGAFKTGLEGKVTAANTERDAFNSKFQNLDNKLASNQLTDFTVPELADLGISDSYPHLAKLNQFNQGLSRYGGPVSINNYVTNRGSANTNLPTVGGVASQEDYAREAALQQLSGQDLGLADTPEAAYKSNGALPGGVDYMGAFNQAGTTLQGNELDFLKNIAGNYPVQGADSTDFYSKYYPASQHIPGSQWGASGGPDDLSYYTSVSDATASQGFPYPVPTSPQPSPDAKWNPEMGTWLTPDQAGPGPTPPPETPAPPPTGPSQEPTSPQPPGPGWVWDSQNGQWVQRPVGPGAPRPGFGGI